MRWLGVATPSLRLRQFKALGTVRRQLSAARDRGRVAHPHQSAAGSRRERTEPADPAPHRDRGDHRGVELLRVPVRRASAGPRRPAGAGRRSTGCRGPGNRPGRAGRPSSSGHRRRSSRPGARPGRVVSLAAVANRSRVRKASSKEGSTAAGWPIGPEQSRTLPRAPILLGASTTVDRRGGDQKGEGPWKTRLRAE
jgi:hypothetical protein